LLECFLLSVPIEEYDLKVAFVKMVSRCSMAFKRL
jgi:hypothetical protein